MNNFLDQLRTIVPESYRARFYAIGAAIVAALTTWGALDDQTAPAVAGVIVAIITLGFAALHTTSQLRMATYGAAAAISALCVAFGWVDEAHGQAILGIVAPILGIGIAAAHTNATPDLPEENDLTDAPGDLAYEGHHRAEQ